MVKTSSSALFTQNDIIWNDSLFGEEVKMSSIRQALENSEWNELHKLSEQTDNNYRATLR